jgi:hypothetical protein
MKLSEFRKQMADTTGYPVAYHHFKVGQAPQLPFIVYYVTQHDDVIADDSWYFKVQSLTVELYTDTKDEEAEKKLEEFLSGLNILPTINEVYIDDEKMYEVIYEFDLEMEN